MFKEEFDKVVLDAIDTCYDLLVQKNSNYNAGEDKLQNFKVAAELQGVNTRQALAGMMAKHTVSVYDMCTTNDLFDMEVWDEKITDSINYLLLLKAVVVDEQNEFANANPSEDPAESPVPPIPASEIVNQHYYQR